MKKKIKVKNMKAGMVFISEVNKEHKWAVTNYHDFKRKKKGAVVLWSMQFYMVNDDSEFEIVGHIGPDGKVEKTIGGDQ